MTSTWFGSISLLKVNLWHSTIFTDLLHMYVGIYAYVYTKIYNKNFFLVVISVLDGHLPFFLFWTHVYYNILVCYGCMCS